MDHVGLELNLGRMGFSDLNDQTTSSMDWIQQREYQTRACNRPKGVDRAIGSRLDQFILFSLFGLLLIM